MSTIVGWQVLRMHGIQRILCQILLTSSDQLWRMPLSEVECIGTLHDATAVNYLSGIFEVGAQ